jgi:DNA-binding transcriptional ArsR family regulator
MMAVNLSVTVPGDQLWLRVIGPPGSGKSTMAMAFGGSETVRLLSKLTGFHSGYVGDKSERKKGDSSLIPQLHNKMVINKDADTILTSPNRDSILGESRELYDGESEAVYRNRKSSSYAGHRMSFVWCGTDVLRGLNRTPLGERFLDCDIYSDRDQEPYLQSAHRNTFEAARGYLSGSQDQQPASISDSLKSVTAGFIKYLWDRIGSYPDPIFPNESQEAIRARGELVSFTRTKIDRVGHDMAYRPRRELGTRLVSQFTKIATCLTCVFDHPTVDETILRLVRKLVLDTTRGFRMEIIRSLYVNKSGLSSKQLERKLRLPITTIRHHLRDMLELGIIRKREEPNRSGIGGRNVHLLILTDEVRKYYKLTMRKD